ncbi:MAG TPA: hypothetical protein PKD24_15250 [Pyrinomonadaceae bacterium]|nr:hypothetical protein [Pyrinomonadaceae bacterium]HMP66729.1 hypothetical protein [Pyrinomonadaceae bacterium]
MNTLYYGDDLNILREYIADESVRPNRVLALDISISILNSHLSLKCLHSAKRHIATPFTAWDTTTNRTPARFSGRQISARSSSQAALLLAAF